LYLLSPGHPSLAEGARVAARPIPVLLHHHVRFRYLERGTLSACQQYSISMSAMLYQHVSKCVSKEEEGARVAARPIPVLLHHHVRLRYLPGDIGISFQQRLVFYFALPANRD